MTRPSRLRVLVPRLTRLTRSQWKLVSGGRARELTHLPGPPTLRRYRRAIRAVRLPAVDEAIHDGASEEQSGRERLRLVGVTDHRNDRRLGTSSDQRAELARFRRMHQRGRHHCARGLAGLDVLAQPASYPPRNVTSPNAPEGAVCDDAVTINSRVDAPNDSAAARLSIDGQRRPTRRGSRPPRTCSRETAAPVRAAQGSSRSKCRRTIP